MQCLESAGGASCYTFVLPNGYGKHLIEPNNTNILMMHTQDVRAPNSPPLAHMIEFASMHTIEPSADHTLAAKTGRHEQRKGKSLKPLVEASLVMFGNGLEFTYPVAMDRSMFALNTYYFPTRTQLFNVRVHWHPAQGDEMWLVRGGQDVLGVPRRARKDAIVTSDDSVQGFATYVIPNRLRESNATDSYVSTNEEELTSLRDFMNANERELQKAVVNWHRIHPQAQKSADSEANGELLLYNSSSGEIPLSQYPHPPEILCKFYGQTETVTEEWLKGKEKVMNELYRTIDPLKAAARLPVRERTSDSAGSVQSNSSSGRRLADGTPPMPAAGQDSKQGYVLLDTRTEIPMEQQLRNMFKGALPGSYYRAGLSSQSKVDGTVARCERLEMLPGELLTVIHFLVPRSRPLKPTVAFDPTPSTTNEHTVMRAWAHLPDINIY